MATVPVSVIVITKNAETTLRDTLVSINENEPAEIIVIDGMSTDHTVNIAGEFTDKIYSDEGLDKAYARQMGAEKAGQEYIAYIDADVTLKGKTLITMYNELRASSYVVVSAKQLTAPDCLNYWGRAGAQHTELAIKRRRGIYLGMMACIMRKETILRYGFDPTAGPRDDVILENKLLKAGLNLGVSSTTVFHHHKMDLKSFIRYHFFLGQLSHGYLKEYGWVKIQFWPPIVNAYWLAICFGKLKLNLVPYFLVDGLAETAGIIKSFLTVN